MNRYVSRNPLFSEPSLLQEYAKPLQYGRQHLYVLVLLVSVSWLLAFRKLLPSLALTAESLHYSATHKPACGSTITMCLFQGASHNFMHAFLCMCLSLCCISHSCVERNYYVSGGRKAGLDLQHCAPFTGPLLLCWYVDKRGRGPFLGFCSF